MLFELPPTLAPASSGSTLWILPLPHAHILYGSDSEGGGPLG